MAATKTATRRAVATKTKPSGAAAKRRPRKVSSKSELIDTAIAKRLRIKGKPETRDEMKKFLDHLLRQGFSYDLIREKMKLLDELDSA